MPWTSECRERADFAAQVSTLQTQNGSIGKCQIGSITAKRTAGNLARSPWDCIYGNLVISGRYEIEQFGHTQTAEAGDLVLYDSSTQLSSSAQNSGTYHDLSIMIHKSVFEDHIADQLAGNILLKKAALMRPLDSALKFLSKNLHEFPAEELEALFDAAILMLPSAVNLAQGNHAPMSNLRIGQEITRELIDYINREISNPELSPTLAAAYLGISVRYVHKLLATSGTTFSTYVTNLRLDRVSSDLSSTQHTPQTISQLAFRWGFNDLTTFDRLFRRKFGMTPKEFRRGATPDTYGATEST